MISWLGNGVGYNLSWQGLIRGSMVAFRYLNSYGKQLLPAGPPWQPVNEFNAKQPLIPRHFLLTIQQDNPSIMEVYK